MAKGQKFLKVTSILMIIDGGEDRNARDDRTQDHQDDMLLILTSVMGYELKTAVGTSVFIMTFTALTGAVSHFAIGGLPDPLTWGLCVVFTLLWARVAAVFANKARPRTLNRATGVVLVVLGAVVMGFELLH